MNNSMRQACVDRRPEEPLCRNPADHRRETDRQDRRRYVAQILQTLRSIDHRHDLSDSTLAAVDSAFVHTGVAALTDLARPGDTA